MNPPDALRLELRSDPCELPAVREQIQAWLAERGWSEQQVSELVLALDEALTNVIRHGYDNACTFRILVTCFSIDDAEEGPGIEVRVRDFGKQVDPESICGRNLDDVRPGGLGVHIIRSMTNSAHYERADGGGMRLIMRKYRSHVAAQSKQGSEP